MSGKTCDMNRATVPYRTDICGRPARYLWDDPSSRKTRPVCGIHVRTVRSWYRFTAGINIRPIELATPDTED
jgi:hypothetical protein